MMTIPSASELPVLMPLFLLAAAAYSSVGFAGGSTYLALLAASGIPTPFIAPTALFCNIAVSAEGCRRFVGAGYFRPKTLVPFLAASLPAAYAGGRIPVGEKLFFLLLGLSLAIAAVRLFLPDAKFKRAREVSWRRAWGVGVPVGAALGLLSGLTGIGGGIFLSPVLYFLGWAEARSVAASASVFILANSVAGLFGQLTKTSFAFEPALALPLAAAALAGGFFGAGLGSRRLSPAVLRRATALFVMTVAAMAIRKGF